MSNGGFQLSCIEPGGLVTRNDTGAVGGNSTMDVPGVAMSSSEAGPVPIALIANTW